jgi:GGDEF domain-containing protein
LVGETLTKSIDVNLDFVGHIGGDDFILICQSRNWEDRCKFILNHLEQTIPTFYSEQDRKIGGVEIEDRQGKNTFYPFSTLSIGAVKIDSEDFANHYEVSRAMTIAKKEAKRMNGNSIFYERRYREKEH